MSRNHIITNTFNHLVNKHTIKHYLGYFDYGVIKTILNELKTALDAQTHSVLMKKRCYHVIGEGLENIVRHGYDNTFNQAFFILNMHDSGFEIIIGNLIDSTDKQIFENNVAEFKGKTLDEIKHGYSEKLSTTDISQKGGAGLGLYDIAIKSNNQFSVEFEQNDEFTHFCKMTIIIS